MAFPDILIGSKFDAKGFKQAETAVSKLAKSVKGAAGVLGLALSAKAAFDFGKASVKAFAEAEKANNRLATVVDNLGLSFATADIQGNLDAISAKAGIAGEELAAAYQPLLTTTGSVIKSQELLNLALDIAAGSGENLSSVTNDLSQAFVGNTKGLKKYNTGLTQAELKSASFTTIQSKLNEQFSGSNAKYLETYAGRLQVLTEAAGNAQEVIGGGLIDAFKILGTDTSISKLSDTMGKLATNIADFFRGLAIGFRDLAQMPVIKQLMQLAGMMLKIIGKVAGAFIDPFTKAGAQSRSSALADSSANSHLASLTADANAKAAAKAEAAAKKRAQDLVNAQKKNTAELKKQAGLKKNAALFDLDQIQIVAALKGKLSDEERKRVELQLALITENSTEASKLTYQIAKAQGLTEQMARNLADLPAAKNPFEAWATYLDMIAAKAKAIVAGGGTAGVPVIIPSTNTTDFSGFAMPTTTPGQSGSAAQFGSSTPWAQAAAQNIVVQIDGKAVATAVQNQNNSGNFTGFSRLGDFKTL